MELTNGNSALTPHERTTCHTQTRGTAARGLNKVLSVSRVKCSINKFNSEDEECQRTGRQYASVFNFTHEPSHTRLKCQPSVHPSREGDWVMNFNILG